MGDNPIPPTTFTTTSEGDAFLSIDIILRPFASEIKPSPAVSSFGDATRCLLGVTPCHARAPLAPTEPFALRFLAAFFLLFQAFSGRE